MPIKGKELLELFIESSELISREPDRCGHLIYSKKKRAVNMISDTETRYVLANLLSAKGIDFGVKFPTQKKYPLVEERMHYRNTDMAIFTDDGKQINIEVELGQTHPKVVARNFEKFLGEAVFGCSSFSVLKYTNVKILSYLLERYSSVYEGLSDFQDKRSKWFLLFFFLKQGVA